MKNLSAEWKLTHKKKKINFLEVWQYGGWHIKIYYIGEIIKGKYVDIAKEIATESLPADAFSNQRYGIGFIIIHPAALFDQITIDWWEMVNELRHHVFKSMDPEKNEFTEITCTGESFCVWELKILSFERDNWIRFVLKSRSSHYRLKHYLNAQLNIYT